MGLNYIKCNLRQISNKETGELKRVTLLSVESDMDGYRNVDAPSSQIYELPYILHALSFSDIQPVVGQMGFPYSFSISF